MNLGKTYLGRKAYFDSIIRKHGILFKENTEHT